jgi:hypothetical protein
VRQPPRITSEGVLEYLGEFIVSDNQSFNLVGNGGFRRFVHYVAPTLKERQLPHSDKIRSWVLHKSFDAVARVKEQILVRDDQSFRV